MTVTLVLCELVYTGIKLVLSGNGEYLCYICAWRDDKYLYHTCAILML